MGFAFGLQEALDQVGAFAGPLIFTAIFYFTGKNGIAEYQLGYKTLIVPFIALMLFLFYAYRKIQHEELLPIVQQKDEQKEPLKPVFWIYTAFTFFAR